ncbi:uncharacterized protein [Mytilus edulis]|uniref:uncharacterized protein n=1 Tax=Mytilus edulis TaxID=6550 RepID=UPI0039EF08D6
MMPKCTLKHFFFLKVKVLSLDECACTCSQFKSCSRLAWDSTEKECMLHSEIMRTNITGLIVNGVDLYSRGWEADCNKEGYDFEYTTRTCLKLFDVPAVSWTGARAICKQDGGDLISITTKLKLDFVHSYITCVKRAWIGLRNKTWMNGESFVDVYGNKVQLNDFDKGYEHDTDSSCLTIFVNETEYSLYDASCNIRLRKNFVCELVI